MCFRSLILALIVITGLKGAHGNGITVDNWKYHFRPGSTMGLFLAIAVPIGLPRHNAYLAYTVEAVFLLPSTQNSFTYPPIIQRDGGQQERESFYKIIETKLEDLGYSGKQCLLRTICEASMDTMKDHNGVIGDLLHIIFTPSTSTDKVPNVYQGAENQGKNGTCIKYHKKCKISVLDLISWIGSVM